MRITLFAIWLSFGLTSFGADLARYETITCTVNAPASVQVVDGEVAECFSLNVSAQNPVAQLTIQKNGQTFDGTARIKTVSSSGGLGVSQGTTVVGPASISLAGGVGMLTVKFSPTIQDVNKTVIIPPSTNKVFITMETSTNLLLWADATNGLYGSPDTARFFRIRMDKLQ